MAGVVFAFLDAQEFRMQTAFMVLVVPLGILALLLASGTGYQAVGTARDRRRGFSAPGVEELRRVRADSFVLEIDATKTRAERPTNRRLKNANKTMTTMRLAHHFAGLDVQGREKAIDRGRNTRASG